MQKGYHPGGFGNHLDYNTITEEEMYEANIKLYWDSNDSDFIPHEGSDFFYFLEPDIHVKNLK